MENTIKCKVCGAPLGRFDTTGDCDSCLARIVEEELQQPPILDPLDIGFPLGSYDRSEAAAALWKPTWCRAEQSQRSRWLAAGRRIDGYACRWNVLSQPGKPRPGWREVIRPNAFLPALRRGNVIKLQISHVGNTALDDTACGLELLCDDYGLRVHSEPRNRGMFAAVAVLVRDGLLGGLSVGGLRDENVSFIDYPEHGVRVIETVHYLPEVSLATNPQWPGTIAQLFDRWPRETQRSHHFHETHRLRTIAA